MTLTGGSGGGGRRKVNEACAGGSGSQIKRDSNGSAAIDHGKKGQLRVEYLKQRKLYSSLGREEATVIIKSLNLITATN